jgi:hypothetical protein
MPALRKGPQQLTAWRKGPKSPTECWRLRKPGQGCPGAYLTAHVHDSGISAIRYRTRMSAASEKLGGDTTIVCRSRPPLFARFHVCRGQTRGSDEGGRSTCCSCSFSLDPHRVAGQLGTAERRFRKSAPAHPPLPVPGHQRRIIQGWPTSTIRRSSPFSGAEAPAFRHGVSAVPFLWYTVCLLKALRFGGANGYRSTAP